MERENETQQRESLPPTLLAILLKDPLSEITRQERLYLLGVGIVGITIKKTDLVPSQIGALGIEFEEANQDTLLFLLGLVVGYFLAAFIIYGVSDLLTYVEAYQEAKRKVEGPVTDRLQELARQRDILGLPSNDPMNPESDDEHKLRYQLRIAEQHLRDLGRVRRPAVFIGLVRGAFEYLLPIVVGVYAVIILVIVQVV
jgi:hypothetical protein